MDAATRRNLELTLTLDGRDSPTLAWVLDTTRTSLGARLLRRFLHQPLRDQEQIRARQAIVAWLDQQQFTAAVSEQPHAHGDMERTRGRMALPSAPPPDPP